MNLKIFSGSPQKDSIVNVSFVIYNILVPPNHLRLDQRVPLLFSTTGRQVCREFL